MVILYTENTGAISEAPNRIYLTYGEFKFSDDVLRFTVAHEMAHLHLNHHAELKAVSIATTGAMLAANFVVPGAGLLNHAVNPAVVNNFSKTKEFEADKKAFDVCVKCLKMPPERVLKAIDEIRSRAGDGGGFWSTHPSWEDRIENITGSATPQQTIPH